MSADDYCCAPARKSMFLRHAADCRVWKPRERQPSGEDIGQGEGCEGGKCAIRPEGK